MKLCLLRANGRALDHAWGFSRRLRRKLLSRIMKLSWHSSLLHFISCFSYGKICTRFTTGTSVRCSIQGHEVRSQCCATTSLHFQNFLVVLNTSQYPWNSGSQFLPPHPWESLFNLPPLWTCCSGSLGWVESDMCFCVWPVTFSIMVSKSTYVVASILQLLMLLLSPCFLHPFPCFSGKYIPCGSAGKESACNAGDLASIPGLGRCPGEGHRYPLQYSGPENPMDCIVHGVAKSWTWLSGFHIQKGYCFSIKTTKGITFKDLILLKIKGLDLNPGTTINWGSASDKEPNSQCRRSKRFGSHPWVGTILWRREWQPTPVSLPG